MSEQGKNSFQCVAILAERDVVRYSPAGVQIVSAKLLHSSEQFEAGSKRLVEFEIAMLAAGEVAGKLIQAPLGVLFRFSGFLARKNRNSKSIVFHLTDFEPIT